MTSGEGHPGRSSSIFDKRIVVLGFCVLSTFAVYIYSALHNKFTDWDDGLYVTSNYLIKSWSTELFTARVAGNWAPVHLLFITLEYHIFGLNPMGYHMASLMLHVCNVVLVFYLILKLSNKVEVAGIVALFFGIHPMHVESVAWVSAQKDLLYSLFYFSAMLSYIMYKEHQEATVAKHGFMLLTLIFFMFSCLSKAMGITLPVALVLVDSFLENNWNWKFIARNATTKLLFFLISVGFGTAAYFSQKDSGALTNFPDQFFGEQLMFASYGLMVYVAKFMLPLWLSAFYAYPLKNAAGLYPRFFYISPVIVILSTGLLLGTILWRRKNGFSNNTLFFGLSFFIANIILVLQLKAIGLTVLAERYTYLSYTGLLFIAAGAFNIFWEKYAVQFKKTLIAGSGILILVFLIITGSYASIWRDSVTLWTPEINKYESTPAKCLEVLYSNLGIGFENEGKFDLAIADYKTAISLNPKFVEAHNNLGHALTALGQFDKAIAECTKAISLNQQYSLAYYNRAVAYANLDRPDLAIADYNKAIELNSKFAMAYHNRGLIYTNYGKPDLAIPDYTTALKLNPQYPVAYFNRGVAYATLNQPDQAILDFTYAIDLDPKYADAYHNRGLVYANHGKPDLAISDYNTAISLNPKRAEAYDDRGIAYAVLGKLELALADFTMSISLDSQFAKPYNNLGFVHGKQGKPDLAISDYTAAIRLDSLFAEAYNNRGCMEESIGNHSKGQIDIQKAKEIERGRK